MAHHDFVDRAREAGVRDARVLDAIGAVDRDLFVPPELVGMAGIDAPVPLPYLQTTSQPSLVALMVEALAPEPTDRVLEVGTGYGFEAAVLSHLVDHVWTVEWWPELAQRSETNLVAAGITNVDVVTGDGSAGLPEVAPFDGIILAARCEEPPPRLVEQLAVGGRLVLPLGARGTEECVVLTKQQDGTLTVTRNLGSVRFVPLVGEGGDV